MTIRRCFTATCAGMVLALFSPDLVLGQQGPPPNVPPHFPPGLHDRALPPGKPFTGGDNFEPPGRDRQASILVTPSMLAQAAQAASGLASGINTGAFDPGPQAAHRAALGVQQALADAADEPRRLLAAVAAYNELVRTSGDDFLVQAPAELRELRTALLELPGVRAVGILHASAPAGHDQAARELALDGGADASGTATHEDAAPPAGDADAPTDLLRQGFLLSVSEVALLQATRPWTMPGMAANTPLGFGAVTGDVWAGASYQPRVRRSDGHTGAAAVGFGLGDSHRYVALQVGLNSFSTVSSGFFRRSAIDLHLHRTLPGRFGVAVGWESAVTFGSSNVTRDSGSNRYAVASRWFSLGDDPDGYFSGAMLSAGVGDGRFQSERAFVEERGGWGVFGSAAVRVAPPVSMIAEWTGQDLMLASAITPLRDHDVGIIAGLTDVTGSAGDGARFVVGMTTGYSFR